MDLLIHIGLHKTGSTSLQRFVFSRSANRGFCCELSHKKELECPSNYFQREMTYDNYGNVRSPFDMAEEAAIKLEKAVRNCTDRVPVLSHERLSGDPNFGGVDALAVCERLSVMKLQSKVLIVVREQASAAYSNYVQFIRSGGVLGGNEYINNQHFGGRPGMNSNYYRYDLLVSHYVKNFGKNNVLVMPYELMKNNSEDFYARINDFCGVSSMSKSAIAKSNSSDDAAVHILLRKVNFFFHGSSYTYVEPFFRSKLCEGLKRKVIRVLSALVPIHYKEYQRASFEKKVLQKYSDVFRKSNSTLQKYVDFDLNSLGYLTYE